MPTVVFKDRFPLLAVAFEYRRRFPSTYCCENDALVGPEEETPAGPCGRRVCSTYPLAEKAPARTGAGQLIVASIKPRNGTTAREATPFLAEGCPWFSRFRLGKAARSLTAGAGDDFSWQFIQHLLAA
ncbi:MAG: hypothetical protein IT580_05280 [Verrucomicrobiales bacterium]|nr:hypothetical protein [Verrucomicrobiales bacterium]